MFLVSTWLRDVINKWPATMSIVVGCRTEYERYRDRSNRSPSRTATFRSTARECAARAATATTCSRREAVPLYVLRVRDGAEQHAEDPPAATPRGRRRWRDGHDGHDGGGGRRPVVVRLRAVRRPLRRRRPAASTRRQPTRGRREARANRDGDGDGGGDGGGGDGGGGGGGSTANANG